MNNARRLLDLALDREAELQAELDFVTEQLAEMTRLWVAEHEARMALIAALQGRRDRDDTDALHLPTDPFAAERVCAAAGCWKCRVSIDIGVHDNGNTFRVNATKNHVRARRPGEPD